MNSFTREHQSANTTTRQARRWLLLQAEGLSDQQRREFESWCIQSRANRQEYERLEKFWQELDLVRDDMIEQYAGNGKHCAHHSLLHKWSIPPLGRAAVASVAMIFVTVLLCSSWLVPSRADHQLLPQTFASATGQVKTLTLADGSVIDLGPKSSVIVNFSADQRLLLLNRGEAFFDVAKDPSRPFIVNAAGANVKAVGTQFNIYLADQKATVTVHEGKVNVTAADKHLKQKHSNNTVKELNAGDSVSYSAQQGFTPVVSDDLSLNDAWREGVMVFDSKPLKEVVADLNRYHAKTIIIADHKLDDIKVNGVFKMSDSGAVLRAIENSLPTHVVHYNQSIELHYKNKPNN